MTDLSVLRSNMRFLQEAGMANLVKASWTDYYLKDSFKEFDSEDLGLTLNLHLTLEAMADRVVAQVRAEGSECNREYVLLYWLASMVSIHGPK